MPKYKDTDYLHISSRIKMLEAKLLGKDAFEKIIDADTPEDAVRVLTDNGYDAGDKTLEKPEDFELLLMAEQAKVYDFLADNVCDRALIDLFRIPYDYMNIKAALKAEYLGIKPDRMLFSSGTKSKEEIVSAVAERDKTKLSPKMYDAVLHSLDVYAKNGDPQQTDIICDRACYEELLELAKNSPFDFLYTYFTKKVDLINISTFVRQRKINKKYLFFEKTYIPSPGGLKLKFFEELYEQPLSAFVEALLHSPYMSLAENINPDDVDVFAIEAAVDEFSSFMITSFRYVPFGPQIPVSYLLSKDAEIKNLRIALSAKIAGLSGERIRERLRLGYV